MELREADKELEKLENDLNYYVNKKYLELLKVTPKPVDTTKENVKGGKREDKFIKYVSSITEYDKKINEINEEIFNLQEYVESELKRLNKYDELTQQIVYYKEKHITPDHHKLTWEEIAKKVYTSRENCRKIYRKWKNKRNV